MPAFPFSKHLPAYAASTCALAIALSVAGPSHAAEPAASRTMSSQDKPARQPPLHVDIFNPGVTAMFPVASVLVEGKQDAILFDTQFSTADAQKLVQKVKDSGKRLTTIFISQADPDYYFGLDTLHQAFPQAKILATPQTISRIQDTKEEKLRIWGPKLGSNAPARIVVPEPLQGDTLTLEGQTLQVVGLDGPEPGRTFIWAPAIKTVLGGIPVNGGKHVFMADARTPQAQADWLSTLARIRALQPKTVVPGHFIPGAPLDLRSVDFTENYIRAFAEEAARAQDSAHLIAAMKQRFPGLGAESSLELSAKVVKGEMPWK